MVTDVRLDDPEGHLVLDAFVVRQNGSDFMIDSAVRRNGNPGWRRALVHDENDSLTINFNSDYTGGVTINSVTQISPQKNKALLGLGTLLIRGGISYQSQGITIDGRSTTITSNLEEELLKLRSEISLLRKKVEALENR